MNPPPRIEGLSDAARAALSASSGGTEPYSQLVVSGSPHSGDPIRRQLAALTPATVLASPPRSAEHAQAVLAGLWLWHDFLDESHTLSQAISSATGSFWHGIMHRREGDFSNAKYWYARCRRHPVLDELARTEGFDPDTFVDLVERVHRNPNDPKRADVIRLQRAEWEALFRHCVRAAAQD